MAQQDKPISGGSAATRPHGAGGGNISAADVYRGQYESIRAALMAMPRDDIEASISLSYIALVVALYEGDIEGARVWQHHLVGMRKTVRPTDAERPLLENRISHAMLSIACAENACPDIIKILSAMQGRQRDSAVPVARVSLTHAAPSVLRGAADLSEWGRHYKAMQSMLGPILSGVFGADAAGITEAACAELLYERGEFGAATLDAAAAQAKTKHIEVRFACFVQLARLACVDPASSNTAAQILSEIRRQIEAQRAGYLLPNLRACEIRIAMLDGAAQELHDWLANEAPNDLSEFGDAQLYMLITKARVYIAVGKLRDAAALLERLCLYLEQDGRVLDHAECLVLSAVVCSLLGVHDRALERIDQALDRAYEYGYVRLFADNGDLVCQLLRAYLKDGRHAQSGAKAAFAHKAMESARTFSVLYPMLYRQPDSGETRQASLTQTELHILEMLAQGLSNAQIGERLSIKLPTVKFHVSNLLDKLGVKNRTGAVHEGRQRKLIP